MPAGLAASRAPRSVAASVVCGSLVVMGSFLCGCSARRAAVRTEPQHSAGLAAGEGVAIVLHEYRVCREWAKEGCVSRSYPLIKERQIEGCVEWGMRRVDNGLRIVRGARFRHVAFPRVAYRDLSRSPEEILSLLGSPEFRERIAPLRIRYLVVVAVSTEKRDASSAGEIDSELLAIGSEWRKETRMQAAILDVMNVRETATIASEADGKGIIIFPFVLPGPVPLPLVLPLPPVGWSSPTGPRACSALAEAAARVILGGGPPD